MIPPSEIRLHPKKTDKAVSLLSSARSFGTYPSNYGLVKPAPAGFDLQRRRSAVRCPRIDTGPYRRFRGLFVAKEERMRREICFPTLFAAEIRPLRRVACHLKLGEHVAFAGTASSWLFSSPNTFPSLHAAS